jgi:arginyl-tRNA synthetase
MTTDVLTRYRNQFVQALATALEMSVEDVARDVKPADPAHGDFAFPAFGLAKKLRKAPPAIAAELAAKVSVPGLTVAAVGPYVNARLAAMPFSAEVVDTIRSAGSQYGHGDDGKGKTVVIDYSSPNIAKPIAFHHIRSTMIGNALAHLYRALGWRVEGINYLGDWGKQFGLVATGFQEYGDPARRRQVAHLVEVYVKANKRAEEEPAFDERARAFFKRMEDKDPEATALWTEFRDASIEDLKKVYARLGVEFQHFEGESRYQDMMAAVIKDIEQTVGTRESDGATIVNLPTVDNEPPVLLRKNDGSTLYATRDLAAACDRYDRFKFERSLYVVAADQSLHFRQFFNVLAKMNKPWADRLTHVAFGRVHGMSTRKGNLVLLTDVLDEAKNRALEKVTENQKAGRIQTDDAEKLADQIGLGAVVFGDLKNRRTSDYEFDWEAVLSFEGHTGAYLQYTHARTCNILRKGGGAPKAYDATLLALPEEQAVLREIARLPSAVRDAVAENEPSNVARVLLDVGAAFSRYYTAGNQDRTKRVVLEDNNPLRDARLALTDAVRLTLASGMALLGVPAPENM